MQSPAAAAYIITISAKTIPHINTIHLTNLPILSLNDPINIPNNAITNATATRTFPAIAVSIAPSAVDGKSPVIHPNALGQSSLQTVLFLGC